MELIRIIKKYLEDNNYDGLYDGECACVLEDLIPCSEYDNLRECEPGYKISCDGSCDAGHCDFHIGLKPSRDKGGEK